MINSIVDTLTKKECQEIIDYDHAWDVVDILKKNGCIIKCESAEYRMWSNQYPLILKEQVVKYEVGDFCSEHIDTRWPAVNPTYIAHVTWITPLNKGYEGGELYIDGELTEQVVGVPHKIKIPTLHEITAVTKGTRYSLVAWVFKRKFMSSNTMAINEKG